ncbi:uncharacterized LOC128125814 homolog [Pongo abelii]|nr:uncharacterized LOC128125814 homolog [Pongo abelii]
MADARDEAGPMPACHFLIGTERIVLKMSGWQRQSQNQSWNLRRECSRRKCIFIHHHT